MATDQPIQFSISELAKEFDITTRSIRFYEDQGLLAPERKGQTRIYSVKDRVRLKLVLRGKRLGFSLAETKTIFDLYDTEKTEQRQLETMLELIASKKEILAQQLLDITSVMDDLEQLEKNCNDTLKQING
ncbi:MerR family transcriptional regulator [Psychrosphaera saromensis]|uniref:MerR family transcriptional regulator n=1 Tax=Psychrosphaera saromensis TaxID=716813 RepID=A0A2S7UW35_9GAMM|nr:MerR family DNA-binding transcriptional regulator [Psychrosphaera saromensis]PQJ53935.1 MerR family transcriptional regulator [Psychrosphaera saromensis]GHB61256.1 MerR family transcriptional regulator [Psychrosphaera saromensis]GLQ15256.1 MerR family transcriptional regulator [Psychrosphaera saromensis]